MPPKRKRSCHSGCDSAGLSAYTDSRTPESLGGVERYAHAQGLTPKEALEELWGQLAYTLHRPV